MFNFDLFQIYLGPRSDRKKLSWTYRNKKRQGKIVRPQESEKNNVQVQNNKARIIVRNLSFKVRQKKQMQNC